MSIAIVAAVAGTLAIPASASASLPSCGGLSSYYVVIKSLPPKGTTQLPTTANGVNNPDCVLGRGSQGWGVVAIQFAINSCSNGGLTVDGIYGRNTEAAVTWVQASVGITADGVYGPQTRAKAMRWPVWNDDGDLVTCVSGRDNPVLVLKT